MALYPFEVLPSIWKRSQESKCVCEQQNLCLDKPKAGCKDSTSPNAPLASLSAVCEYPRKTILQTAQLEKGVMLPCTSPLVTKNNCMYKKKGCELFLISKDKLGTSSHQADLDFSTQAAKKSQPDSMHQTPSTTKCTSSDNSPVDLGGDRFSQSPSVI